MTSILDDEEIKTNEISFENLSFKVNNINQKAQSATRKIFAHYFVHISQNIMYFKMKLFNVKLHI